MSFKFTQPVRLSGKASLKATVFTVPQIFAGGVTGAFYLPDPQDVFADHVASSSSVYGGSVGLVYDEKNGTPILGPELVTNGTFDSNINGWSAASQGVISWENGQLRATTLVNDPAGGAFQQIATIAGQMYQITVTVSTIQDANTSFRFGLGVNAGGTTEGQVVGSSPGTYTSKFIASSNGLFFCYFTISNNLTAERSSLIDNVSVREISGNHALQVVPAARPLFGRSPNTAIKNMLSRTEEFNNSVWSRTNATVIDNFEITPSGSIGSKLVEANDSNQQHSLSWTSFFGLVGTYTFSIDMKAAGRNWAILNFTTVVGAFSTNEIRAWFDLATGSLGTVTIPSGTIGNATIVPLGNDWYRCSITMTYPSLANRRPIVLTSTGNNSFSHNGDGTSGILISRAQFEMSSSFTTYQRVVSTTDITETGVPSYPFVRFDLSDDALSSTVVSSKNLLRFTEEFDNAIWSKSGLTVSTNFATSPDGTLTADKIYSNNGQTNASIYQSVIFATGANIVEQFDIVNGTFVSSISSSFESRTIIPLDNGWFRIAVTYSGKTASAYFKSAGWNRVNIQAFQDSIRFYPKDSVATAGNANDGILIWGAQLELGTTATDYQYGGFSGDIIVAGRSGSAMTSNVKLPDGAFTLGSTSYTGGTPTILRAIGDVVGWSLIGKTLRETEKQRLIQFYKNRGAKGFLVSGPELVTNGGFDTNTNGWTASNATLSVSNGIMTVSGTVAVVTAYQTISVVANRTYRVVGNLRKGTASTAAVSLLSNIGSGTLYAELLYANSNFEEKSLYFTSSITGTMFLNLRVYGGGTGSFEVDSVSVKEFRPEEEW